MGYPSSLKALRKSTAGRDTKRKRALISSPPSRLGNPAAKRPSEVKLRRAVPDVSVRHIDVAVLDDDLAERRAPEHTPGSELLPGEPTFDARLPERADHHTIKLAVAADRRLPRGRAKGREQSGQDTIALLPVCARHMKWEARALAVGRAAFERHVGSRRGHPTGRQRDPLRIKGVRELPPDREGAQSQSRAHRLRAGLAPRGLALDHRGNVPPEHLHAVRWLYYHPPFAAMLRVLPKWPLQQVPTRRAAGHTDPLGLQEIGEGRKIDFPVADVETGQPRRIAAERCHRERKLGRAAIQTRGGVEQLEPIGHPDQ